MIAILALSSIFYQLAYIMISFKFIIAQIVETLKRKMPFRQWCTLIQIVIDFTLRITKIAYLVICGERKMKQMMSFISAVFPG